jgi:hypothetical protein
MNLRRTRLAVHLPDVLGMAWVLGSAVAVLVPALVHGSSLGPFDVLSRHGLSARPGVVVHYTGPDDQIAQMIPWTTLVWTQVHHGHLPLWNPYSGLGMPLMFNWQSAAFSLPALLGYLFPVHLAYTVAQITTLVVAGSGVYLLGRVLRLGVLGATTAAVVYELSGPLMGWLGWPIAGANSWAGWVFAAAILIVRGRHRARHIAMFAVALAGALYAGQPESVVLFTLALVVFLAVYLALRALWSDAAAPVLRPVVDLAVAAVAGAALSAPLVLPGLQLASSSVVRVVSSYGALPPHDLGHLLFSGFDGLPVAGNTWFGNSIYPETAAYIGVIAVALAVVAVATRPRRPEVPALAAAALAMAALAFGSPVVSVVNQLTGLHYVAWHRAIQPMVLALAVLAGVGMDAVVRSYAERGVRRWTAGAFGAVAAVVALLWLFGRGQLPSVEAGIRARSFVWPAIETAVGAVVAGALALAVACGRHGALHAESRPRTGTGRGAGLVLLACETAFLVSAGAPLVSSSPTFLVPTPAESALQRTVGGALVAFGSRDCHTPPTLGIHQDVNVVFAVHELAVFDPITPEATFRSLRDATGQPASSVDAPLTLCPAIDNATVARRYGVGFILEHAKGRRPAGTTYVSSLGDEKLYRVPGAAAATLTTLPRNGADPPVDAPGTPVAVTHPDLATWTMSTDAATATVLRLHLTDVPGWHATVDGRSVPLDSLSGSMLEARIATGRHTVELRYWPSAFTDGIIVAIASVVGLGAGLVLEALRRRRHR